MTYVVYADVMFGYNLAINLALYTLLSAILQQHTKLSRRILWACLTAMVSLGIFLCSLYVRIPYYLLYATSYFLMTYFYLRPYGAFRGILTCVYLLLLGSFLLLGALIAFRGNGNHFVSIAYAAPAIVFLECLMVKHTVLTQKQSAKIRRNTYYVTLSYKNQTIRAKGYLDTGNLLMNPFNQSPVIVMDVALAGQFLSAAGRRLLQSFSKTGEFPYEALALTEGFQCFPIPCQTVGASHILPAFSLSGLQFEEESKLHGQITAAISREVCFHKMEYDFLLHESLNPNRKENSND